MHTLHQIGLAALVAAGTLSTIPAAWADPCAYTEPYAPYQEAYLGPTGSNLKALCGVPSYTNIVLITTISDPELLSILTGDGGNMVAAAPGTPVFTVVADTSTPVSLNAALAQASNLIDSTPSKAGVIAVINNGPMDGTVQTTLSLLAAQSKVVLVNIGDAQEERPEYFSYGATGTLCDATTTAAIAGTTTAAPAAVCVASYDATGVLSSSNYGSAVLAGALGDRVVVANPNGITTRSGSDVATVLAAAIAAKAMDSVTVVTVSTSRGSSASGLSGGAIAKPLFSKTPLALEVYAAMLSAKTSITPEHRTAAGGYLDAVLLVQLLQNGLAAQPASAMTRLAALIGRGLDLLLGIEDAWAALADIKEPPQNSAMMQQQVSDVPVIGSVIGAPTLEIVRYATASDPGVVEWCVTVDPAGASVPTMPIPAAGGGCPAGSSITKIVPYTMAILPASFFNSTLATGMYGLRLTATQGTDTKVSVARFTCEEPPAWIKTINAPIYGTPTLADLDGDGQLDVTIGTAANNGEVIAMNTLTGSEIFHSTPVDGPITAAVTVADLDRDDPVKIATAFVNKEGVDSVVAFDPVVGTVPASGWQIGAVLAPATVMQPFQADVADWVDTFAVMNNLGQLYWFWMQPGTSQLTVISSPSYPAPLNLNCANDATGTSPLGGPPCSTNPQSNRKIEAALVRPSWGQYYGGGALPGEDSGTYRLLTASAAYPTFSGEITMFMQAGPPYGGPYDQPLGLQHAPEIGPLAFVNGDPPPGSLSLTPLAACLNNFGPTHVIAAQAKPDKSPGCLANPSAATCLADASVVGALEIWNTFVLDPANPWAKNPDGSDVVSDSIADYIGGNGQPAFTLLGPGGTVAAYVSGESGTLYKLQYDVASNKVVFGFMAKPEPWQGKGITEKPTVVDILGDGTFYVLISTTAGLTVAFDAMTGEQVYTIGGKYMFPRGGVLPGSPSANCYLSEKNTPPELFLLHKWDKSTIATCAAPQVAHDAGGKMQLLTLTSNGGPAVLMARTLAAPTTGASLPSRGLWQRALAAVRSFFSADTATAEPLVIPYVLETEGGSSNDKEFTASEKIVEFQIYEPDGQPVTEPYCVKVTRDHSNVVFSPTGVPKGAECQPHPLQEGTLLCTTLAGNGTTDGQGRVRMLLNGGQEPSLMDPTQLDWDAPVTYDGTVTAGACAPVGAVATSISASTTPQTFTFAVPLKATQLLAVDVAMSSGPTITPGEVFFQSDEAGFGGEW